jgi:hypothetical protein
MIISVILGGLGLVTSFFQLDPLFLLNTASFSSFCYFALSYLSMNTLTLLSEASDYIYVKFLAFLDLEVLWDLIGIDSY